MKWFQILLCITNKKVKLATVVEHDAKAPFWPRG